MNVILKTTEQQQLECSGGRGCNKGHFCDQAPMHLMPCSSLLLVLPGYTFRENQSKSKDTKNHAVRKIVSYNKSHKLTEILLKSEEKMFPPTGKLF